MNRILLIGCGDIAMRVIPLLRHNYRIFALTRNLTKLEQLRAMGALPIMADLDQRASLQRIAGLADIVLHFAPPANNGDYDSRTRQLLAALSRSTTSRVFIYISTTGVYGDCGGTWISESRKINPQTARAQRRADAEQQIRAWAQRNGVHASILRVPGIYAANRLPLQGVRTPSVIQEQDSYTSHIHADDLARIVVAVLRYGKANRVYHACNDSQLKMGDYLDAVADAHHLPRVPRLPRAQVQSTVSPMMWSFINESRRLSNVRIKRELHVKLRYPQVTPDGLS